MTLSQINFDATVTAAVRLSQANMRTLSFILILLLVMHLAPAASGADIVQSQMTAIPTGTGIEVHLKSTQKMRGALGPIDSAGFTLVNQHMGDQQIAFADVASVKRFNAKSHLKRNILIGTVIGVAALGITAGVLLRCGPLGCGFHPAI